MSNGILRRWKLRSRDHGHPRFDDPALFQRDRRDGLAQVALVIQADRARYWLSVGAQPSDVVVRLLKEVSVLDANGKVIAEAPAAEG